MKDKILIPILIFVAAIFVIGGGLLMFHPAIFTSATDPLSPEDIRMCHWIGVLIILCVAACALLVTCERKFVRTKL